MKGIILKMVLAGLIAIGLQSMIILIQYFYQSTHPGVEFFIRLGFPYKLYYFSPDLTFHGVIMNHLIYDGFVSFLFSFLVVLIISKMRRKRKNKSEPINLMDEINS
nr:hypothetical protein [uncultured Fluviicola sp.]